MKLDWRKPVRIRYQCNRWNRWHQLKRLWSEMPNADSSWNHMLASIRHLDQSNAEYNHMQSKLFYPYILFWQTIIYPEIYWGVKKSLYICEEFVNTLLIVTILLCVFCPLLWFPNGSQICVNTAPLKTVKRNLSPNSDCLTLLRGCLSVSVSHFYSWILFTWNFFFHRSHHTV